MAHTWRLLILATIVGCQPEQEEQGGDYTSLGFSKALEERIEALETDLDTTSSELAALQADHAALLASLDERTTAVEELASANATDLDDFSVLV